MNTPSKKTGTSSSNSKDEAIIIYQQRKMQFHGTRKGDLETIDSYIKKLKSAADSLTAIGNPISDPDLVLQLVAGLPHSPYLLLKNTISSQLPLPNFSEACSMLYEYEKTTSTPPPPPPSRGENSTSNTGKSTLEMIHDIANTVTSVVPIASEICNAISRRWSVSGSSGTPTRATPGPGNTKKGSTGGRGRGNNNRGRGRGGGGGRGGSSTRNSTGK
ncbi:uncharacterized protein [Solanum lycopersicum]|uniref:Uncharacterized protein n=1 Tax=Solanum lycopersicum TaxID=4081 RepID=A0A3Q7EA53_SOLLC|nr:uncharacterized protein LOC101260163 [Solanum lycopersicum]